MPNVVFPVTSLFAAPDILAHGLRTLAQHVQAAEEMAAAIDIGGRCPAMTPGFVAEMIALEATRAEASFDVLVSLCPELTPQLQAAQQSAAVRIRDIRYAVLGKTSTHVK